MGAWGIPAINTVILLSSGATLTWAHWGLLAGKRRQLTLGRRLTKIKPGRRRRGKLQPMLGLPIGSLLEPRRLVTATPQASASDAAVMMREGNVGAVLVVEDDRLVGIFTERDAVYRVMAQGRDPRRTPLGEVMTRDPLTVAPDESFGWALLLMHEHGFRHAPVVVDGRPIGVISARHALDPDLEEFAAEAERRKHIRRRA